MRLVSCYIKNFGKLSNKTFNFGDGITSLIEKNGAGKSTLASFVKAMLYGMESVRETDKDFKDRKHYAPFNEQSYGGTLIFLDNNREYRIEKTFDIKSSSKDEVRIYVDKELTSFEKEIGEEILNLDKDSFDRLLFISAKDIKMESNGNIRKNLNNIIDDTVDGVDYEMIMSKLDNTKKKYSSKKNSDTSNLKEQKRALEDAIINQEKISTALTNKYEERNNLNAQLVELNKKQQSVSDKKMIKECWDTYNGMLKVIARDEETVSELLKKYPQGYPTSEELIKLENLIKHQTSLVGESKGIVFDEAKRKRLNDLKDKFPYGVPSDLEMESIKTLTEQKEILESSKYGIIFSENDNEQLERYKAQFKHGLPSDEDISLNEEKIVEYNKLSTVLELGDGELSEIENDIINRFKCREPEEDLSKVDTFVEDYKTIEESVKSIPKFEETIKQSPRKNFEFYVLIFLLSIVSIGIAAFMFFVKPAVGIVFIVIGILGVFVSAFFYLKRRIDSNVVLSENQISAGYAKQEELLRLKAGEIHKILTPYGIYTDSIYSDVEKFKNDYARFQEIINKLKNRSISDKEYRDRFNKLNMEITNFLSEYTEYDSFDSGIQRIKESIKGYAELNAKYNKYEKDNADNTAEINKTKQKIYNITSNYKIVLDEEYKYSELKIDVNDYVRINVEYTNYQSSLAANKDDLDITNSRIREYDDKYSLGLLDGARSLNSISSDITIINSLKKDIRTKKDNANNYKIEKNLVEESRVNGEEQLDYMSEINSLTDELAKLDVRIDEDEMEVESLEDNKQLLDDVKKQIKHNEHRFEIISKLEEELKESQKSLDNKYVAPIMDKFEYYSSLLGNVLKEKIEMGRNFDIVLNVNGQLKSDEHLSSGQRSICALCFRLALLDNIYGGNVPFIIMDDPFVALDSDNFNAIVDMLNVLSKGKQIIYFSCHESRKIKNNN